MVDWLWNRVAPIATIGTFVVLFIIFAAFSQLYFKPRTATYPAQTLDGRIKGFWPSEVDGILEQFKGAGKLDAYQTQEYVDLVFPLVYGLMLLVAIVGLARAVGAPHWLMLFPAAAVIGDYVENVNAIAMIVRYRVTNHAPAALTVIASVASRVKWTFTIVSLLTVIVLIVWRVVVAIKPPVR